METFDVNTYLYNKKQRAATFEQKNLETRFADYRDGDVVRIERPIDHGCYRRYLNEQSIEGSWLIVFGSNLNLHLLESRVGKVGEGRVGWIPNFRLLFNKQSLPLKQKIIRKHPISTSCSNARCCLVVRSVSIGSDG